MRDDHRSCWGQRLTRGVERVPLRPATVLKTATTAPAAAPAAATSRRAGLWRLPEVRWAAVATVLFAAGLIGHFTAAPGGVAWAFLPPSYAGGGWGTGRGGRVPLPHKALDVAPLLVA